jgi:hypothetical protein
MQRGHPPSPISCSALVARMPRNAWGPVFRARRRGESHSAASHRDPPPTTP